MIASTIGNTFLKSFNKQRKKKLTAKEFFDRYYFESFYNHKKYMQWITNSPFVQMKKEQKVNLLSDRERQEKLENFHAKVNNPESDASIAIGYPASETKEFATTSGLVTDILLTDNIENKYLSWIGGGLGVGVAGGYSIFFDKAEILEKIYEGWRIYRSFLNDKSLEKLCGNQIDTWNGQWLNFVYSKDYRKSFDFAKLSSLDIFNQEEAQIKVKTIDWSRLFFNISRHFPNKTITGYVYSLGQTNKTLGFYPFRFSQARRLFDIYKQLFGENDALTQAKDYEKLFGKKIKRACELGAIGLQALEPKDLRDYFKSDKLPKFSKSKTSEEIEYNNLISFRTYKTWLLAMITKNKEETLNYTEEIAKALLQFRKNDNKGLTKRKNLVENDLLISKTKKVFIDKLTEILKDIDKSNLGIFKQLRDKVHLMTSEDFGYFIVLLKFDYAYQVRNNNN